MTLTTNKLMIDREVDLDVRVLIERAYRRLNELTTAVAEGEVSAEVTLRYADRLRWFGGDGGTTTPPGDDTSSGLVNTGTQAFLRGDLIGVDSDDRPALALADSVRAGVVAVAPFGAGAEMLVASAGLLDVAVEADTTPAVGDPVFLSASEAGTATPTRPTASYAQLLGQFWSTRNAATGLARVALHISLQHVSGL